MPINAKTLNLYDAKLSSFKIDFEASFSDYKSGCKLLWKLSSPLLFRRHVRTGFSCWENNSNENVSSGKPLHLVHIKIEQPPLYNMPIHKITAS
jgi:hypothetical protein